MVDREEVLEEARRRFGDPADQEALQAAREADWAENTVPASEVFALRLRETREARRMNQGKLAAILTASGTPMSKTALLRLERGQRGLSLDEALAITEKLAAVFATMLTPPEDKLVRLSESLAIGGADLRTWMVSGATWRRLPTVDEVADAQQARFERNLIRLSLNLVDTLRISGEDGKVAKVEAVNALVAEVRRREEELATEGSVRSS